MNPYAYYRRASNPSEGEQATPAAKFFLRSIFTSHVNPVTIVAVVIFAVVSVIALSWVARSEIAVENYTPISKGFKPKSQVLGIASYGYNTPVCNKGACLNHMLIDFQNGGWQARIDYQLPPRIVGYIRVNGWKFMNNISGSGSGYTGYDLEPGENYRFVLYGKYYGKYRKLVTLDLTAPPAPINSCPVRGAPPEPGCYYDYSYDRCGIYTCPPSYGYSTVNVGPVEKGSWREGWIESIAYGSIQAPGSLKISGWAYDQGSPANISMTLRNRDTGAEFKPTEIKNDFGTRGDVTVYLRRILGATVDNSTIAAMTSFLVKFENLPAGYYYIHNAKYNGYLFNVHNQAYQPLTISSQPPSYGYAQPVVYGTNPSGNTRYVKAGSNQASIFSFRVYAGNQQDLNMQGFNLDLKTFPDGKLVDGLVSGFVFQDTNDYTIKTNLSTILSGGRASATFNGGYITIKAGSSREFVVMADFSSNLSTGDLLFTLKRIINVGNLAVANDDFINGVIHVDSLVPSLKVLTPNGGEQWQIGLTQTIKWSLSGLVPDSYRVAFSLVDGPTTGYILDSGTPPANNGQYSWTIGNVGYSGALPTKIKEGTYRLKIDLYDGIPCLGGACPSPLSGTIAKLVSSDTSDAIFNIVTTTKPKLYLGLDSANFPSGTTVYRGTSDVKLLGLEFTAPRERDVILTNLQISDLLNGSFSTPQPSVSTDVANLSLWDGMNQVGQTVATLYQGGNSVPTSVFENLKIVIPAGTTKSLWVRGTIPRTATAWAKHALALTAFTHNITDVDSNWLEVGPVIGPTFTIIGPDIQSKITITYPSGGEKLVKGASYIIKWDSLNVANVYLKLRKNSVGDTVTIISDVISNTGSYQWTVPTNLVDGNDYVIRVISSDQKTFDDSDSPFSIIGPTVSSALSASLSPSSPSGSVNAGSSQTEVFRFVLTASNSDVTLRQLNIKFGGTLPAGYISNVKVIDNLTGVVVGSYNPKLEYDNIGFVISSSITISANTRREFSVKLDLNSSAPSSSLTTSLTELYILGRTEPAIVAGLPLTSNQLLVNSLLVPVPSGINLRYLKIETPSSNSWVAWREVEFYDANGNKILPASATASGSYSYSTPDRAFDGNIATVWNSGNYSGTITFDLGQSKTISKIRILPANYPNPAQCVHYIYASSGSSYTELTRFSGPIYDNQWLTYTP